MKKTFQAQKYSGPHREVERKLSGKTIFTNTAPVLLVHRIVMIFFCLGFVAVCLVLLDRANRFGNGPLDELWKIFLILLMSFCALVALLALLGVRPFQSKRIK